MSTFEDWYAGNAFDLSLDPIGSRDCSLQRKAYQARQPEIDALKAENEKLRKDSERYQAINAPEIHDFIVAVEREALHQRDRWGSKHDAGKEDSDWFWLVGYLTGKAIRPASTIEKQLHHIITAAAALLNWHSHKLGTFTTMRPGIDGAAAMTAPDTKGE